MESAACSNSVHRTSQPKLPFFPSLSILDLRAYFRPIFEILLGKKSSFFPLLLLSVFLIFAFFASFAVKAFERQFDEILNSRI